MFETFAGIGAQNKAIKNIKMGFEVIGTSEWDARAVIAYSQIHHKNEFERKLIEIKKWSEEEINKYLFKRTFSLNSKNPGNVLGKSLFFKQNLTAANIVNNNFPNIKEVSGDNIKNIDLLTYSFPCQGLSVANMGRDKGISENSESTSNLIWEIRRILLDARDRKIKLPKFLLMENVKNLLSEKHIHDYRRWLAFLNTLGYKTNTVVLNGLDHGSLQKRERVFAISILDSKLKTTDAEFAQIIKNNFTNKLSTIARKEKYKAILSSSSIDEIKEAIPNNTPSRQKMAIENIDLLNRKWATNMEWTFNTLTTKQDRHPNIGMVAIPKILEHQTKLSKRFITPREGFLIMGFENKDFDNVYKKFKEGLISKEALYRQAGNSIVVSVLEDIFKYIGGIINE